MRGTVVKRLRRLVNPMRVPKTIRMVEGQLRDIGLYTRMRRAKRVFKELSKQGRIKRGWWHGSV